jgi:DNA-binding MarR family transcriptional regulator
MSDFILDEFLPYQLAVLSERVSREFSALYRARFGISIPEWRVVAHLSQSGPVSVREIAARAAMDKSKTSRAAARLEAAGYVTKRPHPEDKRLIALDLTGSGRAMVAEITPLARAYEAEVMARLGADAEPFRRALSQLLAIDAPPRR